MDPKFRPEHFDRFDWSKLAVLVAGTVSEFCTATERETIRAHPEAWRIFAFDDDGYSVVAHGDLPILRFHWTRLMPQTAAA